MQTIELFSGTASFSKIAEEKGYKTLTIDIEKKFNPDICKNIFELQREDLPKKINILWASPPCTTFSVASLRHYWINKKPKNKECWLGISLILKTLMLISEIKKDNPNLIWFIENPRGMLRKQKFMENLHRKTISYCQYGDDRMKPTDIWTNLKNWTPKPMCSPGSKCHNSAKRGSDTGTQGRGGGGKFGSIQRAVIPGDLFREIFQVIELKRGVKEHGERS